jgi:hypothetical protein
MPEKKFENTKKSFEIRSYKPGDENAICALFERVFGKPMGATESIRHWQWEFLENPLKPVSIMLAWDGKRLVSQEAANLLRVYSDGKEYLGLQIFDTMTDPSYEGLGIFTATAKKFYKELSDQGYQFVFGFPNANVIYARTKKLSWKIIYPTPIYVRPLDMGPFIRKKTKSNLLGKYGSKLTIRLFSAIENFMPKKHNPAIEIRKENAFDKWTNELWDKCKGQHRLWVVRDYKYLSWRYNMRPESTYNLYSAWMQGNIIGYIITTEKIRNEGKVVFIADVLSDIKVDGVVDALLKTVIYESAGNGASLISSMIMPNSVYYSAFRRNLFMRLPQKLFPQEIHFGGYLLNNAVPSNLLYNPNSWHINWGDTDLL